MHHKSGGSEKGRGGGEEMDLQHVGAVVGFVQEASLHDEAQHLFVGHALVRLFRQGGDLPQHHPERPAAAISKLDQDQHHSVVAHARHRRRGEGSKRI